MSKAPRADIALLRKLTAAKTSPGFVPSQLLGDGGALLDKAKHLEGLLKQQTHRQDNLSTKTEWLLTYQKLQDERDAAEKELLHAVQTASSHDDAWVTELLAAASEVHTSSLVCKTLRQQLRSQMKGLTAVVRSLAAYGTGQLLEEAEDVWGEINRFSQQLCDKLEELLLQNEEAAEEVQAEWPSAMPNPTAKLANTLEPPHGTPLEGAPEADAESDPPPAFDLPRPSTSGRDGCSSSSSSSVAEVEALEELLGAFVLMDDAVTDSVRGAYKDMRVGYVERMTAWRRDYDAAWTGAGRSTGGWAPDEHLAFVSHYKDCMRDLEARGGRETVLRRVAALLPNRSVDDVARHEAWYTTYRLLQRRYKDLKEGWARDLEAFMCNTRQYLECSEDLVIAQAEAAADRLEWEALRAMKGEELSAARQQRAAELEVADARRREEEAVAAERAAVEEARWSAEAAMQREAVARYREEKRQQRRAAEQEMAAAAAEAAQQLAQDAPLRQERLEFRQAKHAAKLAKQKSKQRQLQEQADAQQQRLDSLRAQVQPHVEADPERLLAPTACQRVAAQEQGRAFNPVHGYTATDMMADPRFKVTEALMAAGLHRTEYGRLVIAAARSHISTRPDNLTSHQQPSRASSVGFYWT